MSGMSCNVIIIEGTITLQTKAFGGSDCSLYLPLCHNLFFPEESRKAMLKRRYRSRNVEKSCCHIGCVSCRVDTPTSLGWACRRAWYRSCNNILTPNSRVNWSFSWNEVDYSVFAANFIIIWHAYIYIFFHFLQLNTYIFDGKTLQTETVFAAKLAYPSCP